MDPAQLQGIKPPDAQEKASEMKSWYNFKQQAAAQLQWMKTPEAQKMAKASETKAWNNFQQQFPHADRSKFENQANFAGHKATAEIFFKDPSGVSTSVFGSDRQYWSPQMKTALGIGTVNGFPYQLSPLKTKTTLPIPAVAFTQPAPSINRIFANLIPIYVTPDSFFTVQFREIFEQTRLEHNSATESRIWSGGPNMKYWPQQLNFAV